MGHRNLYHAFQLINKEPVLVEMLLWCRTDNTELHSVLFCDRSGHPHSRSHSMCAHLLPEQTLPGGEVGALEHGVLQNTLNTTQRLDDISAVVVQVPKLAVVFLHTHNTWEVMDEGPMLRVK